VPAFDDDDDDLASHFSTSSSSSPKREADDRDTGLTADEGDEDAADGADADGANADLLVIRADIGFFIENTLFSLLSSSSSSA
jgi:hypothetical protein